MSYVTDHILKMILTKKDSRNQCSYLQLYWSPRFDVHHFSILLNPLTSCAVSANGLFPDIPVCVCVCEHLEYVPRRQMHGVRAYVRNVRDMKPDTCWNILSVTLTSKLLSAMCEIHTRSRGGTGRLDVTTCQCFKVLSWQRSYHLVATSVSKIYINTKLLKMWRAFSITYCCTGGICQNMNPLQGNSWSENKYENNSVKAALLRSNTISKLNWQVCKQAAFQGWESVWGRSSEEYDIYEHWGITRLGAGADRPSQPCVTDQKTKAPGGQRCWSGERSHGDAFSSRLLERRSRDGLSRGPRGRRDHTPDTVVFVGSEHTAALSSFFLLKCASLAHTARAKINVTIAAQKACKGDFEALEK